MTTLRTFIAIELDDKLRANLESIQSRLRSQIPPQSVRWVRPEGIHLTLKFLGDTPLAKVDGVKAALVEAAAEVGPFSFTLKELGCFPSAHRPRVVWVGLHEPTGALATLRDAIEAHVSPLGFPTEQRPFQPHLTLGRVQRQATRSELQEVSQVIAASNLDTSDEVTVAAVSYIKSDLRPSGAVYTTLLEASLAG